MAAIDDLIKQILGQNTTAKWTGEGYGGAEANAKAMANVLDRKQSLLLRPIQALFVQPHTLSGWLAINSKNFSVAGGTDRASCWHCC